MTLLMGVSYTLTQSCKGEMQKKNCRKLAVEASTGPQRTPIIEVCLHTHYGWQRGNAQKKFVRKVAVKVSTEPHRSMIVEVCLHTPYGSLEEADTLTH